ncbi:MAG: metal-dependent transcriptional regulator [Bdellovibrionales bacterium]|jgi:DtxR family transcriptional regulator, Mn-dependent transcriptional regulator|nr:metal-dependent transcriptional regulator [Bdellovibrionales bacterium]MBT3526599.1 metal-dependent transcriptional regulator [Bdellovibrionales bacterium]MBT7668036.1 metal-dependent transcriptional regulator [Bdellovibrionales bacterium]MBT7767779.1 metal-dependent transcriptional regulator [Bdellovibrionales bacterium]
MKRQDIDECLEIVWHLLESHGKANVDSFKRHDEDDFGLEALNKLEKISLLRITDGNIELTDDGQAKAKQVVRCHRLAERLLSDVLGMKPDEVEKGACEFEHILAPELVESICTLLGHPKLCPHGTSIPSGDCCQKKEDSVTSAVIPLTKAKVGVSYKVAYINTGINSRLEKLLNFQITPGVKLKISQKYPSYVIQGKNMQLAMDQDITEDIFVWKNGH